MSLSPSPTPPRYMSGGPAPTTASEAPAAPTTTPESPAAPTTASEAPAAPTTTPDPEAPTSPTTTPDPEAPANGISGNGKLGVLSASSAKVSKGLKKIYKKAVIIGVAATDICDWFGYGLPKIPWFFKTYVSTWIDWSQLPGFFEGLSCVLEGANDVVQGSSVASGAFRGSSQMFHAICSYVPSVSFSLPISGKAHGVYTGGSCPQQGLHSVLSYHIIKRSYVDSVLIVQDSSGSRRSPKKVLPRVQIIRTMQELKTAVAKFKNGDPVHLIDVSENDVNIALALDFWEHLLEKGATALLKRDSNLCRMSKMAYSLRDEKIRLQSELTTLKNKVDDIKQSMAVVSDMLQNTKTKSGRSINFSNVGVNLPSTSVTTPASSEEKKDTGP